MKCYNHPENDAVATCANCQKWLCHECASIYQEPVCVPCNQKRINYERQNILKDFWIMLVLGIGLTYLWVSMFSERLSHGIDVMFVIVYFYIFFSVYNWWKFLNKITPEMFLFMSIIGWIIYFAIKFCLSLFVWVFVTPIVIYQKFKRLIELNKIKT